MDNTRPSGGWNRGSSPCGSAIWCADGAVCFSASARSGVASAIRPARGFVGEGSSPILLFWSLCFRNGLFRGFAAKDAAEKGFDHGEELVDRVPAVFLEEKDQEVEGREVGQGRRRGRRKGENGEEAILFGETDPDKENGDGGYGVGAGNGDTHEQRHEEDEAAHYGAPGPRTDPVQTRADEKLQLCEKTRARGLHRGSRALAEFDAPQPCRQARGRAARCHLQAEEEEDDAKGDAVARCGNGKGAGQAEHNEEQPKPLFTHRFKDRLHRDGSRLTPSQDAAKIFRQTHGGTSQRSRASAQHKCLALEGACGFAWIAMKHVWQMPLVLAAVAVVARGEVNGGTGEGGESVLPSPPDQAEPLVPASSESMVWLTEWLSRWIERAGAGDEVARIAAVFVVVVFIGLVAFFANWIAKKILLRVVDNVVSRTPWRWDNALRDNRVFVRLSHLAPAAVINLMGKGLFLGHETVMSVIHGAVMVYVVGILLLVISAVINTIQQFIEKHVAEEGVPVKGFAQAIKLIVFIIGAIFILSIVFGQSPLYFLSGLGALTAVLLLVFRDALLGLVAGVMISVNEMVRVGDWIEMPSNGADGSVIDVSLTTVKVRNWDRTITTVPSYDLISKSFKNWRGMYENKGRRMKRPIHIDMQTIGFVDKPMLDRFMRIKRLRPYLEGKLKEVEESNQESDLDMEVLCNGRRLTNIGTFRAYCLAYLKDHPGVFQRELMIVRQLDPGQHGLPLEIYAFANETQWVAYEGIQSDIFDHLLSIVGEFGLRVFQDPSGHDLRRAFAGHTPATGTEVAAPRKDTPGNTA